MKPIYDKPDEQVNASINVEDLRSVLKSDYRSFILLYLSEQPAIELGIPDFHCHVFKMMVDERQPKTCIAIPRDHAKTTLAKLAAVYMLAYTPKNFLVYLSATKTAAANATRDIVNFIRTPASIQIFGAPIFIQEENAHGNYTFKWCGKIIILRSLGAASQIRGLNVDNKRPDLAIVDDLESREALAAKDGISYEKLKSWFYSTFMKALDSRGSKVIQIGNLVNKKSLLWDHLHMPLIWTKLQLGAFTKDGEVLWPARWTLASLKADLSMYMQQGLMYEWLAEMLNLIPTKGSSALSIGGIKTGEWLPPSSPDIHLRCITVDPAISENLKYADAAVVAVHVFNGVNWQLGETAVNRGIDPYQLLTVILDLADKWKVSCVGIESDAYQAAMIHIANHEKARLGYSHIEFVKLHTQRKSKSSRIAAWIGWLRSGAYKLTPNDMSVFHQIQGYDPTREDNDDDEIDACAYILQMTQLYLGRMGEKFRPDDKANRIVKPMNISSRRA